jgi:hypothetical protein
MEMAMFLRKKKSLMRKEKMRRTKMILIMKEKEKTKME